ncbi:hypothetical protein J6590_004423 [Homalodisca vitripennis]|nr:hypothetical protein J6590_004423 [Homalodisca vitripennis]
MASPDWLTADFLKSCLESDKENTQKVTVTGFTVEPAAPPGSNYGCCVSRVNVQYVEVGDEDNQQSVSLIVKSPVVGGFMEEFSDFMRDIYETEPKYYNDFISATYKWSKHNIVPKHYKSPKPLCVVLEDLRSSGYLMADRHELLDFHQCRLYAETSAKLHALSVAVYKEHPEIIEALVKQSPDFVEKGRQAFKVMWTVGLRCMAAYLEDKPDYREYWEFIKTAEENDNLWNIFQEMEKNNHQLKALIQADPWCTNMMFKHNALGEATGIKIFDFQSLKYTTPVREFVTFIWSSVKLEVRQSKLDDLYHLYCDSLNGYLEEFECTEKIAFEDFKAEILSFSPLVVLMLCCVLPFSLVDGAIELATYLTEETLKVPIKESPAYQTYQGKAFKKIYPQILDQIAKEGVFDYLRVKMDQLKSK